MAQDPIEETFALTVTLVAGAAAVLIAIMIGVFVVPVVVVIGAAYIGWRTYYYSETQQERRARERTHALYRQITAAGSAAPSKHDFGTLVWQRIAHLPDEPASAMLLVALSLYDAEQFDNVVPPPPPICNSIEGARYRDLLSAHASKVSHGKSAAEAVESIVESFLALAPYLPTAQPGLTFQVPLTVPNEAVEALALPFYREEVKGMFVTLREQLDRNLHEVSGVPLSQRDSPKLVMPTDYPGSDAPYAYLKGTPLLYLFEAMVPYTIPHRTRFEHHHIIAGTGHGKTQTLQYMIARDLEAVARGEASIIVLDSQRQMIPTISRLKCFAPGEPLAGKLVLIDPTDVKFPVALPLFQTKQHSDPAEAERLHNASVELLSYVFKGLLGADLTPYQSTLLGFSLRACMAIPGATIHTLREVLEDVTPHRPHLRNLDPLARRFFDTQYDERRYQQSRAEVTSKLFGIFNNTAFTRMFSSPEAKLDLFTEMNAGKVILIDTASDHMQSAASLFGRLFISLVLQATHERLNRTKLATYFYIDEAYQYFDSNVGTLLEQARKSNVGMVLAHQGLYQLGDLQSNLLANTSIRFAGGVPADAKALAGIMNTTAEFIQSLPKLTFAAHVRGQPTVSITIPAGHMENMERMDDVEWRLVQEGMRVRYAYQPTPEQEEPEPAELPERRSATPSRQEILPPAKKGKRRTETTTKIEVARMEKRTTTTEDETAPTDW